MLMRAQRRIFAPTGGGPLLASIKSPPWYSVISDPATTIEVSRVAPAAFDEVILDYSIAPSLQDEENLLDSALCESEYYRFVCSHAVWVCSQPTSLPRCPHSALAIADKMLYTKPRYRQHRPGDDHAILPPDVWRILSHHARGHCVVRSHPRSPVGSRLGCHGRPVRARPPLRSGRLRLRLRRRRRVRITQARSFCLRTPHQGKS